MVLEQLASVGLYGCEQDVILIHRHIAQLHIAVDILSGVGIHLLAHVGQARFLGQSIDAVDDTVGLLFLVGSVCRAIHSELLLAAREDE